MGEHAKRIRGSVFTAVSALTKASDNAERAVLEYPKPSTVAEAQGLVCLLQAIEAIDEALAAAAVILGTVEDMEAASLASWIQGGLH